MLEDITHDFMYSPSVQGVIYLTVCKMRFSEALGRF